jgi:hypothetical protein
VACRWGGRSDDAARTEQASAVFKLPRAEGTAQAVELKGQSLGHGQPFQMRAEAGESNLGAGAQPIPGPPSLSWDLPISISWTAAQIRWYAGRR